MAFVSPDSFTVTLSIFLLVGVVVGGLASIPGAIFGGIFIQFVPNIADEVSKSAPAAIYGVLLIGLMYLMPTGVMGGSHAVGALARVPQGRARCKTRQFRPRSTGPARSSLERPGVIVPPHGHHRGKLGRQQKES